MNVAREAVMAALVALLEGVVFSSPVNGQTEFVSVSRRLKLWADVPKSQRPALFVSEHREQPNYQSEALPSQDHAERRSLHLHRRQRQKHHSRERAQHDHGRAGRRAEGVADGEQPPDARRPRLALPRRRRGFERPRRPRRRRPAVGSAEDTGAVDALFLLPWNGRRWPREAGSDEGLREVPTKSQQPSSDLAARGHLLPRVGEGRAHDRNSTQNLKEPNPCPTTLRSPSAPAS